MALDLNKLEKELDDALARETKESLQLWLIKKREGKLFLDDVIDADSKSIDDSTKMRIYYEIHKPKKPRRKISWFRKLIVGLSMKYTNLLVKLNLYKTKD